MGSFWRECGYGVSSIAWCASGSFHFAADCDALGGAESKAKRSNSALGCGSTGSTLGKSVPDPSDGQLLRSCPGKTHLSPCRRSHRQYRSEERRVGKEC